MSGWIIKSSGRDSEDRVWGYFSDMNGKTYHIYGPYFCGEKKNTPKVFGLNLARLWLKRIRDHVGPEAAEFWHIEEYSE